MTLVQRCCPLVYSAPEKRDATYENEEFGAWSCNTLPIVAMVRSEVDRNGGSAVRSEFEESRMVWNVVGAIGQIDPRRSPGQAFRGAVSRRGSVCTFRKEQELAKENPRVDEDAEKRRVKMTRGERQEVEAEDKAGGGVGQGKCGSG